MNRRTRSLSFDPAAPSPPSDTDPDSPPFERPSLDALVDQLAAEHAQPLAERADGSLSASRRYGAEPRSQDHVRAYLRRELGQSVAELARERGVCRSTLYRSIERGRAVVDRCNPDRRAGPKNSKW